MPRKKSSRTSKSVRESKLQVPAPSKLRRTMTYVPAMLMLTVIFFLIADGPLGISDALFGNMLGIGNSANERDSYGGIYNPDAPLSSLFTPSVMYWEPAIYGWSQAASLNPNLVATIIQIESCGNPYVTSNAGAQGLVQVIPSNFQLGDNQLDLNTNVNTGLQVFRDCLRWSADTNFDGATEGDPDVGVALACYNGGPSVIGRPQSQWFEESRAYYVWGTGIWAAASGGQSDSATLNQWLQAGGSRLCASALDIQDRFDPIQALIR